MTLYCVDSAKQNASPYSSEVQREPRWIPAGQVVGPADRPQPITWAGPREVTSRIRGSRVRAICRKVCESVCERVETSSVSSGV